MNKNNLTKTNILYHLKTYSNENKPLSAKYFYDEYAGPNESLRDFQRRLAYLINEIIEDQQVYKEFVICSCNDGYYIPKSEEGYLKGINYLKSKIDEVYQRIKFIDEMRIKFVYKNKVDQTDDIFSVV